MTLVDAEERPDFVRTTATPEVISRGVLWKFGSQTTIQILSFGISLGVARLIAPSDYGAAALVLALAAFAIVFSDLSLSAVLVQRKTVSQAEASSLVWFSLGVGLLLTLAFAVLASRLARLAGDQSIEPLLLGVAPVFVISTAGSVPTALLNRRMQFRTLELQMMAATVISALSALLIAYLGGGAWALVGQLLVLSTLLTLFAWIGARWRPSLTFSRAGFGSLASFGFYVAGSRVFFTASANLDTLLVGRFLGAAALGAYAIAYNVLLIPLARIASPIQGVAFPVFSSLEDPAAVGRVWVRANRALLAVVTPALIGLAVESPNFVGVMLGSKWSSAAPALRLLAIGGLCMLPFMLTSSVLQACGRQRALFFFAAMRMCVLVVSFAIGLHWGIVGVAAGYAISEALMLAPGIALAMRTTHVRIGSVLTSLSPIAVGGLLLTASMLALDSTMPTGLVSLLVVPLVGLALYGGYLYWRANDLILDFRTLAGSIRQRPQTPGAPHSEPVVGA